MTSRISYNVNGAAIPDLAAFKAHLLKLQPTALLIMDSFALASELASLLPKTIIIHRDYAGYGGDDDLVGQPDKPDYRVSPQAWFDNQRHYSDTRIWRYAGNEMGYSPKTIRWYTELIEYANTSGTGLKLVVGNWSSGTPADPSRSVPNLWGDAHKLLEYCNLYRDWVLLSVHEYFGGVAVSGFYGGYPSHAGVDPHGPDKDKGLNLIPQDAWPTNAAGITKFHCGRIEFLLQYCKSIGLKPPRIIISEHGADDMSDIKEWLNTLQKAPGYTSISGWRSLATQWLAWYAQKPGWSAERAYFQMLQYLDRVVYKNTPVEGQLIFTWSTNATWKPDDVSGASELHDLLEIAATTTQETPAAPAQPPPAAPIVKLPDVADQPPVVTISDPPSNRIDVQIALVQAQQIRANLDTLISNLQKLLAA